MYGYICEVCGAHLDPGETCDCKEELKKQEDASAKVLEEIFQMLREEKDGQLRIAV